jgi:hypothetical protein
MVYRHKMLILCAALTALAQYHCVAGTQLSSDASNSVPAITQNQTNQGPALARRVQDTRLDCIQNRRTICGKIVKVLPEGLVVDSGYTNIMRAPLNRSWLVPGSVEERPAANLVEGNQPACVCIGLVFLTDLPKKPVAKVYDYVNLTGYPAGQYTYTSVGNIQRPVRKFSAKLNRAVQWQFNDGKQQAQNR